MPNIQKVSVALTGEQVQTMQDAVKSGEYATASEVVREALREWQWRREFRGDELKRLRELLRVGKESGPAAPIDFHEMRTEARRRLKKALGHKS